MAIVYGHPAPAGATADAGLRCSCSFCLGFVMFRPTAASKAVLDQMMQMRAAQAGQNSRLSEQALFNQCASVLQQPVDPCTHDCRAARIVSLS
jgi:Nucleotide-diphospho-sugar transferase